MSRSWRSWSCSSLLVLLLALPAWGQSGIIPCNRLAPGGCWGAGTASPTPWATLTPLPCDPCAGGPSPTPGAPSSTPTVTLTPSLTPTPTVTSTQTPTRTTNTCAAGQYFCVQPGDDQLTCCGLTPTQTPTNTFTFTPTNTFTSTPTTTPTPTITNTPTNTPTRTATATNTPTCASGSEYDINIAGVADDGYVTAAASASWPPPATGVTVNTIGATLISLATRSGTYTQNEILLRFNTADALGGQSPTSARLVWVTATHTDTDSLTFQCEYLADAGISTNDYVASPGSNAGTIAMASLPSAANSIASLALTNVTNISVSGFTKLRCSLSGTPTGTNAEIFNSVSAGTTTIPKLVVCAVASTPTATATVTATPTNTPTVTPTRTTNTCGANRFFCVQPNSDELTCCDLVPTSTPTVTATFTPTSTPTNTAPTSTPTQTPTNTAACSLTDYACLAGRAGGQTLNGGTAASENLTLSSTANATKGKLLFGTSAYDEVNNRLGIGVTSPVTHVDVERTFTDPATGNVNILSVPTYTFTTGNSGQLYNVTGDTRLKMNGNNATGAIYGVRGIARVQVGSPDTGTLTTANGLFGEVINNSAATITNAVSVGLNPPTNSAGGTIVNWYGFKYGDHSIGSTLIAGIGGGLNSGTGKWNLYMNGTANNALVGNVRFGDTTAPTAPIDVLGKFLVDINGKVTQYNNISTVSNGVPAERATVDLTPQTAAIGATTLYTPSASQMFRISIVLQVTTAATVSSALGGATGVVISYTEPDGSVAQSITPLLNSQAGAVVIPANGNAGNTTTTQSQGTAIIYAKTGVAIQYAVGYASVGVTPMAYTLHIKLEAM